MQQHVELWGRKVSAVVKPSLYARTAVVGVPFICPDKQNIVNYYLVNSSVLSFNNDIRISVQYCALFDLHVILWCMDHRRRKAKTSQFSQRLDAMIGIAPLEVIEASYPSHQIVGLLTDFVTDFL